MQRLSILIFAAVHCGSLFGQTTNSPAPGAPGNDAHWPSAAKDGFGTSNSLASNVWFTLTNGVMTEVFYPTLDVPNTQTLQFIVCRAERCESEAEDMAHSLRVLDHRALSFQQVNTARDGAYSITKTYTIDTSRPTILIDVDIACASNVSCGIYLHYDPSLNNSGMHDTGWNTPGALLSSDATVTSALISSSGFDDMTTGYSGTSDGLALLKEQGQIRTRYDRAENGNVVQIAKLRAVKKFTIALAFGANPRAARANAEASLKKSFPQAQREFESSWHAYLSSLRTVGRKYQQQFNMSAMVLKGLEDKTHRGAMIASPSTPWGGGANANEPTVSGYHAVWSRDLYHVATAFQAMGDSASANRALDYLFQLQQKPDGSFPQNSWVNGRSIGGALQLDEVALPIVLAYQLGRSDETTWLKHIKRAADFILRRGPATEQERWEEESGYSPATLAAEIASLVCAAHIAVLNQDQGSANAYLKQADEWTLGIERWTATVNGPFGNGNYYLRVSENQNPNDGAKIEINSAGGRYDEREVVDAGFLELVRLGVKSADDPLIVKSLAIVNRLIKVETPHGSAWYRYNHDAYGEKSDGGPYDGRTGKGRPWPLLTGERGEYELARGDRRAARQRLDSLLGFANAGRMIPEQIWDRAESPRSGLLFGEGTGSATPLAWSMAQFIRLAINVANGRNLETPRVVARRYLNGNQTND